MVVDYLVIIFKLFFSYFIHIYIYIYIYISYFIYRGAMAWNQLSNETREMGDLTSFKLAIS